MTTPRLAICANIWYLKTRVDTADGKLLRQASDGDREALTALLRKHGEPVHRMMERRIPRRWRSVLTAEDVMQETYVEAALHVKDFRPRGDGAFPGWLMTLATNNLRDAIDALETDKRGGNWRKLEPRSVDDSYAALHELLASGQTTPSGKVALVEVRTALDVAIEQLPETYQRVVRQFDLEGRSIQEVAAELHRTSGATFMLRARAHRLLRQIMGSESRFFSTGS